MLRAALAQGCFDMGTGGAGDRSTNLLIGKQPLPMYCNDRTYRKLLVTLKSRKIILDFLKEPCTGLEKKIFGQMKTELVVEAEQLMTQDIPDIIC